MLLLFNTVTACSPDLYQRQQNFSQSQKLMQEHQVDLWEHATTSYGAQSNLSQTTVSAHSSVKSIDEKKRGKPLSRLENPKIYMYCFSVQYTITPPCMINNCAIDTVPLTLKNHGFFLIFSINTFFVIYKEKIN